MGITANNAEVLRELIQQAAIEGEVIEQASTDFGQQFKVDWTLPDTAGRELRTIWEITATNSNKLK